MSSSNKGQVVHLLEYTKKSKEYKFHQENVRIFRTHLCTHHSLFLVLCSRTMVVVVASVVDWHRFDADPDPNFHVDADPDPVLQLGINMMPIRMRILP